ncbi:MAG: flagellar hook-length control protein FliK [Lachnospiraceae bacterium]|nr:flagellar hook-length control protein FliK [Lachnospiraceae bacterium]
MDNFQGYASLKTGMGQQGLQNVTTSHTTQQVSLDVMLQKLRPGDTFQGEIMSVNGQDVQLQLVNGLYMAARLEGEVQLAIGQLLNFQVQSNQNSKIILKPVYMNFLQQRVGEAALKTANIAVNDKNLQMVAKLIENGMSIDKNSLTVFNRQVLQHPQVNIDSLIRLHQLGIEVNDGNLTQLEHYQNLEYKLSEGVREVVGDIGKLYTAIIEDAEGTGQSTALIKAGDFMERIISFLVEGSNDSVREKLTFLQNPAKEKSFLSGENREALQNGGVLEKANGVAEVVGQEKMSGSNHTTELLTFMRRLEGLSEEQLVRNIQKDLKQGEMDVNILKELLFSDQGIGKRFLLESKDKIYRSEEFNTFLKDTLQNEWSLTPEELTEDGKVKEFYQKLLQRGEQLSRLMEHVSTQNQTSTGNSLQNIRENVEFINQMNQMFQYVQLPLKLSGSQAQGELYVYTNKRNLAKKDGMLTAILHLDMEYLGNVDVNITLDTNTEQVTTRFYMEEETVTLLEEHMEELTERLMKKGYQSQAYFEKRESEKTVFERIEDQARGMSTPLVYQNFDMRT